MASRSSSSKTAEPTSSRSTAASHVLVTTEPGSPRRSRWEGSRPQRTLVASIHSPITPRLSSSNPNRSRTGPRARNSRTEVHVEPAGHQLSRAEAALRTGLVVRIERSASRYRSAGAPCRRSHGARWPTSGWCRTEAMRSWPGPMRPKAASISGAKRSRAGQRTTMSFSVRSDPAGPAGGAGRRSGPRPGGWPRSRRGTAPSRRPGHRPGRPRVSGWRGRRAAADRAAWWAGVAAVPDSPSRSTGTPSACTSASCRAVSRWSRPQLRSSG